MTRYAFGSRSRSRLDTVDDRLRETAAVVMNYQVVDFTIVWGWRDEEIQNALFASHASTKQWPDSTHNHMVHGLPASLGLDFAPWVNGRIPWKDTHAFARIAGMFDVAAASLGYEIRWGGDWNRDGLTIDQGFMDYGHIELYGVSA